MAACDMLRRGGFSGAMKRVESSYYGGQRTTRARVALLLMAAIWGINFSVAKVALASLPPLAFNALRFPLAAGVLYVALRRRGPIPIPTSQQFPRLLALGLFGNLLYQLSFVLGLDRTTAGNASLLLAGTPIVTALTSAMVGHERVRPRVWAGVVFTFAGIVLVVWGGSHGVAAQQHSLIGDLLMLGAVLTWAFYTVGSKPLIDTMGPLAVTAWTIWIGTVGIVLAGVPSLLAVNWSAIDLAAWLSTIYAGGLSIGLAYMIYYYGVSVIGNTRTGSYSNIVPVFALLAAWLWLGEVPRLVQIVGAAIIISGVTIAQSGSLVRTPAVSPEL